MKARRNFKFGGNTLPRVARVTEIPILGQKGRMGRLHFRIHARLFSLYR